MIRLLKKAARKGLNQVDRVRAAVNMAKLEKNAGFCNICGKETVFIVYNEWLRGNYKCKRCQTVPRNRALVNVLNKYCGNWRELQVHESSPSGKMSELFKKECPGYSSSHYYDDVPRGEYKGPHRSEDLSALTLADKSFDLFITSDVFEHVFEPQKAFAEIARVLKPGGLHIFTIPWIPAHARSTRRAALLPDGTIEYYKEARYHGNPIGNGKGSLVTYDWGLDFPDIIYASSGMSTTVYLEIDRKKGLDGQFLEVFISRKPDEQQ